MNETKQVKSREVVLRRAGSLARLCLLVAFFCVCASAEAGQTLRIMPLGDSLTSSIPGQASYRYWLWNRLQRGGFSVDFVGTQWGADGESATPGNFDQDHEGHPGATTDEILGSIIEWAGQTHPQAVLMVVGATDFENGYSPSHALYNSLRIITRLRRVNPNIKIFWAMLPPAADQWAQVRQYNEGVLRLARVRSTRTSPVVVVNLYYNFFPRRDTVDGVHPNAFGEQKFAYRFYAALLPFLQSVRR